MVASMKLTVIWDIMPCGLVETDQRFGGAYCLYHQGNDDPDDGGGKHI
jgi:hypothetical protein